MVRRVAVSLQLFLAASALLPAPAAAFFSNSWHYQLDGIVGNSSSDYDQGKAVFYDPVSGSLAAWGRIDDPANYGGAKHWLGLLNRNTGVLVSSAPWTQTGAHKLGHWDNGGIFPRGGLALAPGFLYAAAEHSSLGGDIRLLRLDLSAGTTRTITLSGPGTCADSVQELVYHAASDTVFAAGFEGDCSGAFKARSWLAAVPGAAANPSFTEIITSTASAATTGWPNRVKLDKTGRLYANIYTGQNAGTVRLVELNKSNLVVSATYTFNLGSEARLYDFGFNPVSGSLYLAGLMDGSPAAGFQERPFLARYTLPSTTPVWISTFPWASALTCFPARLQDLAFAQNGTVYAAGSSEGGTALVSFSEAGAVLDGSYPVWDSLSVSDITVDNLGGIYLAGVYGMNLSFSKWVSGGNASLAACTAATLTETVCHDGIDNDGDDLADCEDSDCAAYPACLPPAPLPLKVFNYPNPFDSRYQGTNLHWELPEDAPVKLTLYDALGGVVRRWDFSAGSQGGLQGVNETVWDGANSSGEKVRQGVYVLLFDAAGLGKKTARVGVKR